MRTIFIYAIVICLFNISCGQSDAQKKAAEIKSVLDQTSTGAAPDMSGAWLKATIDGKEWEAKHMNWYSAGSDNKPVSGETDDITISFQIPKPTTGMEREFKEGYVADLITPDGFFGGRKGKVTITKVDDTWIEGNFYFTANTERSSKTYEVKDGAFRIPNR